MARSSAFASGFDEAATREAFLQTMLMGMPETVEERLTWCWSRKRTYLAEDPAANPYDWTEVPTTDQPGNPAIVDDGSEQTLQVPYALEFSARPAGAATTALGEIDTSRAIVTLIDTDYHQIRTADYARIADARYRIQFDAPPLGLFGLTVWQVFLEAEDET